MSTITASHRIATVVGRAAASRPIVLGVVGVLGVIIGRLLLSPSAGLVATLVFFVVQLLIIFKDPLLGLLVWLILEPFAPFIYLDLNLGMGIPDITLARFTVGAVFILLLARAATQRQTLPRMTFMDGAMLLTAVGIGQSIITSGSDLGNDLQNFFDFYLMPFMVYFTAKSLVVNRRSLKRVLWVVFIIGAYCAIYGVYTQLTGNVLFVDAEKLISHMTQYTADLRVMRGLLDSPHAFGLAFNLAIPISFYLMFKAPSKTRKILCAAVLAVLMLALFLTYKRTAWVAMLGSFVVIQSFYPQFRRLFYILLLVSVLVFASNQEAINESAVVTERLNYNVDTLNGRTQRWEVAIRLWQERPIAGQGYNQFAKVNTEFVAIESHYLNILVSAGLLGFVPYLLMLLSILWTSVKQYRRTPADAIVPKDLLVVFWGAFAAYLISMYTVVMNNHFTHNIFFLLVGAIVGSQAYLSQRSQSSSNNQVTAQLKM